MRPETSSKKLVAEIFSAAGQTRRTIAFDCSAISIWSSFDGAASAQCFSKAARMGPAAFGVFGRRSTGMVSGRPVKVKEIRTVVCSRERAVEGPTVVPQNYRVRRAIVTDPRQKIHHLLDIDRAELEKSGGGRSPNFSVATGSKLQKRPDNRLPLLGIIGLSFARASAADIWRMGIELAASLDSASITAFCWPTLSGEIIPSASAAKDWTSVGELATRVSSASTTVLR